MCWASAALPPFPANHSVPPPRSASTYRPARRAMSTACWSATREASAARPARAARAWSAGVGVTRRPPAPALADRRPVPPPPPRRPALPARSPPPRSPRQLGLVGGKRARLAHGFHAGHASPVHQDVARRERGHGMPRQERHRPHVLFDQVLRVAPGDERKEEDQI